MPSHFQCGKTLSLLILNQVENTMDFVFKAKKAPRPLANNIELETAKFLEYCHSGEKGQTVISLVNRKAKNNRTKINQWAIQRNIRNKGSWIILQAMHPELRQGLQEVGKMRMCSFWSSQKLAN
ncbi:hypothetical protein AYI68_g5723, partial [Smittium mucronatum]